MEQTAIQRLRQGAARVLAHLRVYVLSLLPGRQSYDEDSASLEQRAYADVLDAGSKLSLAALAVSFALYWFAIVPPRVPFADLSHDWSLPVDRYLAAARVPTGWAWLELIGRGDYLSLVPIAFLSALTLLCYGRAMTMFWGKGERTFTVIAGLQIVVLAVAASGLAGWRP